MSTRFVSRAIFVLAALLAFSTIAQAASAQAASTGQRLHLPGVIVTPFGLHAEGLPGYTPNYGVMYHTVDEALGDEFIVSRGDMTLSRVPGIEQLLATSGWQQYHEQRYGLPDTSFPDRLAQAISVSIEQYATPDGAAAAFAVLTSDTTLAAATSAVGRQPLQPATPLGDQALLWSYEGHASDPGSARPGITMMVRFGAFIISMDQISFDEDIRPEQAAVERVMLRQILNIAAGEVSGAPAGCMAGDAGGFCVQRLIGDEASGSISHYAVVNGNVIPTGSLLDHERQGDVASRGLRDTFVLRYNIEGPDGWAFYFVYIDTYADAAGATEALDGAKWRLRESTDLTLESFEPGIPASGDGSASWVSTDRRGHFDTASIVRIDNLVVTVKVAKTSEPLPGVVQTLMQSQLACMAAGDCLAPIPVPPEIVATAAFG